MPMIVTSGAGNVIVSAEAILADAGVPLGVTPHAKLIVAADTLAGQHAEERDAKCLVHASIAVAQPGGPIAKNVNSYVRQTALRSVSWPKYESVVLLHLSTIKHILHKCNCFLVCLYE